MQVREITEAEVDGYVKLFNTMSPNWVVSSEEIHTWRVRYPNNYWPLGAFVEGELVGLCDLNLRIWNTIAVAPTAELGVAESYRGQGIGSALYALASQKVLAVDPDLKLFDTYITVRDDYESTVDFWTKRGFHEHERNRYVQLPLDNYSPPLNMHINPAIEIVSLADRPDLVRAAYEVIKLAVQDIPGEDETEFMDYDSWRSALMDEPGYRADGQFVTLLDGAAVGAASLEFPPAQPGIAWHGMTATHPQYRGHGVAQTMKIKTIAWAQNEGYHILRTDNDSRNAPMRHINIKLGYQPLPDGVKLRGPLSSA